MHAGLGSQLRQAIDKYDCKASKWIEENEPVQREAKRRFRNFLRRFKDDKGDLIYVQAIERMVTGEWGGQRGWRGHDSASRL